MNELNVQPSEVKNNISSNQAEKINKDRRIIELEKRQGI